MGKMNLLRASYQGKVGDTVGQKWKNQTNLCSYTKHSDAKTPAQLAQRLRHKLTIQILSYFYNRRSDIFYMSDPHLTKFQHIQKANRYFLSKDTLTFSDLQSLNSHVKIGGEAEIQFADFPPAIGIKYPGKMSADEKSKYVIVLVRSLKTNEYKLVNAPNTTFEWTGTTESQQWQIAVWVIKELVQQVDGKNLLEIHSSSITPTSNQNLMTLKPFGAP